jgi:hypothetical protein
MLGAEDDILACAVIDARKTYLVRRAASVLAIVNRTEV